MHYRGITAEWTGLFGRVANSISGYSHDKHDSSSFHSFRQPRPNGICLFKTRWASSHSNA